LCVVSLDALDVVVTIEDIQSTEAKLNYSFNIDVPLSSELTLFIVYGEGTNDDVSQRRNLTSLSGSVALDGLKPFTSYTLQLSVLSEDGALLNSNSSTFKTLAAGIMSGVVC